MNQNPNLQELWSNPSERVVFLFRSIQKVFREHIYEKSRQYGFTGPQIGLIIGLNKNPFITLNEMSECLGLSKSTVSGIVDRLVARGVVIREIPETNRRTVRLSLSPEFQKNNILQELINQYVTDTIKGASEEEIEKILSGLEILYALIEKNNRHE